MKNNGSAAVPSDVTIGVSFAVDNNNNTLTWSDRYSRGLNPGESVALTANAGTNGNAWTAVEGEHTVTANVDDVDRLPNEENENNNTFNYTFVVSGQSAEINIAQSGLNVNGYQISASAKGMRTVYTVEDMVDGKKVVSSGIVYALAGYAGENEVYAGSKSEYVKSCRSTEAGKCSFTLSDSATASSYAMTMQFATKEPSEYTAGWIIRGYAQLEDGSIVHTKAYNYTIYGVADYMYQNILMPNAAAHEYLYTDILSIVDNGYVIKEFDWNNMIEAI